MNHSPKDFINIGISELKNLYLKTIEENKRLLKEKKSLLGQINTSNSDYNKLVSELRRENEQLDKQQVELLRRIQVEHDSNEQMTSELKDIIEILRGAYNTLVRDHRKLGNKLVEDVNEIKSLKTLNENLQSQVDEYREEEEKKLIVQNDLKNKIDELVNVQNEKENEIKLLKKIIQEKEEINQNLQEASVEAEGKMNKRMAEYSAKLDRAERKIQTLEKARNEEVQELHKEIQSVAAEKENFVSKVENLHNQIEELKTDLLHANKEISILKNRLSLENDNIKQLTKEKNEHKEKENLHFAALTKKGTELLALENKYNQQLKTIESLKKQLTNERNSRLADSETLMETIAKVKREMSKQDFQSKEQWNAKAREYFETLSRLESEKQDLNDRYQIKTQSLERKISAIITENTNIKEIISLEKEKHSDQLAQLEILNQADSENPEKLRQMLQEVAKQYEAFILILENSQKSVAYQTDSIVQDFQNSVIQPMEKSYVSEFGDQSLANNSLVSRLRSLQDKLKLALEANQKMHSIHIKDQLTQTEQSQKIELLQTDLQRLEDTFREAEAQWDDEKSSFLESLASLQQKNQYLMNSLDQVNEKANLVSEEVDYKVESLELERDGLKSAALDLDMKLSETIEKVEKLKETIKEERDTRKDCQKEIESLLSIIEEITESEENLKKENRILVEQNLSLSNITQTLNKSFHEEKDEAGRMQLTMQELREELEELDEENDNLRKHIQDFERHNRKLIDLCEKVDSKSFEEENQYLEESDETKVDLFTKSNDEVFNIIQDRIDRLRNANIELNNTVESLTEINQSLNESLHEYKQQMSKAKGSLISENENLKEYYQKEINKNMKTHQLVEQELVEKLKVSEDHLKNLREMNKRSEKDNSKLLTSSEKKIQRLSDELSHMKDDMTKLEEKQRNTENEKDDLETKLAEMNSRYAVFEKQYESQNEEHSEEKKALAKHISQLERQIAEINGEKCNLKRDIDGLKKKVQELQVDIAQKTREVQTKVCDLGETSEKLKHTSEELEKAKSELKKYTKKLSKKSELLNETTESLKSELHGKSDSISRLEKDLHESGKKLSESQEELKRTQQKLSQSQEDLKRAQNKFKEMEEELNEEIKDTQEALDKSKEDHSETKRQLKHTQETLKQSEQACSDALGELKKTKEDLENVHQRLESSENNRLDENNSHQQMIKELKEDLSVAKSEIETKKRFISEMQTILTDLDIVPGDVINGNLTDFSNATKTSLQDMISEAQSVKVNIQTVERTLSGILMTIRTEQNVEFDQVSDLSNLMKDLEDQVSELLQRNKDLVKELNSANETLKERNTSIDNLNSTVQRYETNLKNQENVNSNIAEDLEKANSSLQVREDEIASLKQEIKAHQANLQGLHLSLKDYESILKVQKHSIGTQTMKGIKVNLLQNAIDLDQQFQFEKGRSEVKKEANGELLDRLASVVLETGLSISVEGHTAKGPSPEEYYKELSEKRALKICAELEMRGVPRDRMRSRGFGYSKPNKNGKDPKRVEIRVINKDEEERTEKLNEKIRYLKNVIVQLSTELKAKKNRYK